MRLALSDEPDPGHNALRGGYEWAPYAAIGELVNVIQSRRIRVTHIYMDGIPAYMTPAEVGTLWRACPEALVSVVEGDDTLADEYHQRAADWGIDLSGALERAGRWTSVSSRLRVTPDSVRAFLVASGLQYVEQVDINDRALREKFPVIRREAWQCSFLAMTKKEND